MYKTEADLVKIEKNHLWEEVESSVGGFQQLLRQIPMWIGHFPQREEEQVRQAIDSTIPPDPLRIVQGSHHSFSLAYANII